MQQQKMQEGTSKSGAEETPQNLSQSQAPSPMAAQKVFISRLDSVSIKDEQVPTGPTRTPEGRERKHSPATLANMQLRSAFG